MESMNNITFLAKALRQDTISSFQNTTNDRSSLSKQPKGNELLGEAELFEIFYLGLLSRVEKGSKIPEEYIEKSKCYSIFEHSLITKWIINERENFPHFYDHLLKVEACRSFILCYF